MDKNPSPKELTTVALRNAFVERWLKDNAAVHSFSMEQNGDETIVHIQMSTDSAQNIEKSLIHWEGVFDGTYEKMDENLFHGWQSTFTGEPIPIPDMEEWQQQTIENILRSRSSRVLELGSGSGLVLSKIIADASCRQFMATDLSAQAVARLQARFGENPKLEIKHGDAIAILKNFEAQETKEEFDLVILNSVVQYFPNVTYLEDVMVRSIRLLSPGGRLFIGDIRNLDSLDLHALSLEIQNASPTATVDSKKILEKVQERRNQQFELLLSPDYFMDFAQRNLEISHVVLETHRGKYLNEMQRYRFNASLIKKGHPEIREQETESFDFSSLTLESLAELLKLKKYMQLFVRDIPTIRLAGEGAMLEHVKAGGQGQPTSIGQLKILGKKREEECVCLGQAERIGTSEGYRVLFVPKRSAKVCWNVDALFYIPSGGNELLVNYVPATTIQSDSKDPPVPTELFNDPSGNKEKLVATSIVSIQLKRSLRGCPLPMPTLKFL